MPFTAWMSDPTWMVVGGGGAFVLLVLLIVLISRRRRKERVARLEAEAPPPEPLPVPQPEPPRARTLPQAEPQLFRRGGPRITAQRPIEPEPSLRRPEPDPELPRAPAPPPMPMPERAVAVPERHEDFEPDPTPPPEPLAERDLTPLPEAVTTARPMSPSLAPETLDPTPMPAPLPQRPAAPPAPVSAAPAAMASPSMQARATLPPPPMKPAPTPPSTPPASALRAPAGNETLELERSDPRHAAARRLARLTVSEIKLYHEAEVKAGRETRDLWNRLQKDIRMAFQMFETRVAKDVRDRFDYIYDEIVRQLAEGDPAKLGTGAPQPKKN